MKTISNGQVTLSQPLEGPLAPHIPSFAKWMSELRLFLLLAAAPSSARVGLQSVARAAWRHATGRLLRASGAVLAPSRP
jgi:hypothetical protein